MTRFIDRLMLMFLAAFGVSVVLIVIYAVFWQQPEHRCKAHGGWWDEYDRVCGTPIYLPGLTHRPIGSPPLKPSSPAAKS